MKLLFCEMCGSLFSLSPEREKSCDCGRVKGRYNGHRMAVSNGKGYALGMGTGSLSDALVNMARYGSGESREFYLENNRVITWVRPHAGEGNPHTHLEEDSS